MTITNNIVWVTRVIVMIASGMISVATADDAWAGGNHGNQFSHAQADFNRGLLTCEGAVALLR